MSAQQILDEETITAMQSMMKAKFPVMVEYFFEDAQTYLKGIGDGINAGDVEAIVRPAHTLKSSAKQMGALFLSDIAKAAEFQAKEQVAAGRSDMSAFKSMITQMEMALSETKKAFSEKIGV